MKLIFCGVFGVKLINFILVMTKQHVKICEKGIVKFCKDCGNMFVSKRWCGELTCQECLNICWIINDDIIADKLFRCCPKHRPFISPLLIEQHSLHNNNHNNDNLHNNNIQDGSQNDSQNDSQKLKILKDNIKPTKSGSFVDSIVNLIPFRKK